MDDVLQLLLLPMLAAAVPLAVAVVILVVRSWLMSLPDVGTDPDVLMQTMQNINTAAQAAADCASSLMISSAD